MNKKKTFYVVAFTPMLVLVVLGLLTHLWPTIAIIGFGAWLLAMIYLYEN